MRSLIVASFLVLLAAPAAAQSTGEAERLASEGDSKILQALDLLLKTVPQYGPPEMQPNGDIIIRRLHPDQRQDQAPQDEDDESGDGTET